MNKYTATVIKSGNSYALRVPKQYVVDGDLVLGEKIHIQLPSRETSQNRQRIADLFRQLQDAQAFKEVEDPVAWQKELRQDRPLPERDSYGAA